jgi:hypothetical protein
MDQRLENLRMFFPAEVTASFLAVQGLLAANSVGKGEDMWFMVSVIGALAAINVAIYLMFYGIRSVVFQIVLGAGFIIWAINIDVPRYRDFPYLGEHVEITAPTLLIFYTLLTSFFQLPKRKSDATAP